MKKTKMRRTKKKMYQKIITKACLAKIGTVMKDSEHKKKKLTLL
jgi:hypothetical protein